jgi:hypothetical protein
VGRPSALRTLGPALAALALPVLLWVGGATAAGRSAVNTVTTAPGFRARPFQIREFLSYLWQFYLPRLSFQTPFRPTPGGLPLWEIWVQQVSGRFGWLDIFLPSAAYRVLATIAAATAVGVVAIAARFRDRLRLELLAFFALTLLALVFGLHLTEYRSMIAGNGPVIQGRYLLPVIGLIGLAVGLVVSRLPARLRGIASAVVLGTLLVLQLVALASIAKGYYT